MASSIINSDDGVISGTSGIKTTGGDDGVLVFQSKGTETAQINTDKQIVAAAGTASLPVLTTTGDLNTGIYFPAADTAAIATGGSERMRIDTSGNVGIGTSSPSAKLHVAGSIYQSDGWATIGAYNASGTYPPIGAVALQTAWNFTSGGREVTLMNGDSGATGGSGGFVFWQRTGTSTSTRVLGITGNGVYANTTASAANVYVDSNSFLARSTSALKYKTNVRDLPSIDVNKFRPVVYNSKCETDDKTIDYFGIIADEVDEAGIKELVTYGTEGEVEGFQYERFTVVLLKAIQEQQTIIDSLKARIEALENNNV